MGRPCQDRHPDPAATAGHCRLCWLSVHDGRYQRLWGLPVTTPDRPGKEFTPPPAGGPGTELKQLLAQLGLDAGPGCACNARARQMDAWGPDECERRLGEIRAWLKEERDKRGWGARLKAAGNAVATGLATRLSVTDPMGSLIELAIARARAKQKPAGEVLTSPAGSGDTPRPQLALCIVTNSTREGLYSAALQAWGATDWVGPTLTAKGGPPSPRPDWNRSSRDYKRALELIINSGAPYGVIVEDDVRPGRHFQWNLTNWAPYRTGQVDFASLYTPDTVYQPFKYVDEIGGYALPDPARLSGPNDSYWMRHRLYGSQAYVLSREFAHYALTHWDGVTGGQDARMITLAQRRGVPLWWAVPGLVQHDPLVTNFNTPPHYDRGFGPDYKVSATAPCFIADPAGEGALGWLEQERLRGYARGYAVSLSGAHGPRVRPCVSQTATAIAEPGDPAVALEVVAGEDVTPESLLASLSRAPRVALTRYPDPWTPGARLSVQHVLVSGAARLVEHTEFLALLEPLG